MANAYWVATFEVPRGHNRRSIVLKPGVRINRLLEWKVDVAHDGLIVTALMEKQVPDPEPEESYSELTGVSSSPISDSGPTSSSAAAGV